MKKKTTTEQDDLRPEYDFDYNKGVRGKYYQRLMDEGSNVILLDLDVAKAFPDSASVNEALRALLDLNRTLNRLVRCSSAGHQLDRSVQKNKQRKNQRGKQNDS